MRRVSLSDAVELPSDDLIEAVSRAGQRVTGSDVAAVGGISLAEARRGLCTLAAALGGDVELEVSKSGDLVYNFPGDVRGALAARNSAAAAREAWNTAKPALFTALRVAFGIALFVSIAIIYAAIITISTSSSDSDRRDSRRSNSNSPFGGGDGGGFVGSLYYGPSPFDCFFYRPYYTYGGYMVSYDADSREPQKPRMGFLEAVYSFVFGDGDPNDGLDKERLSAIANLARRHGGVLTSEQMAPLLDPPPYDKSTESINVNESWVLPAVAALNGRPEVAPSGQIVYVFDELRTTAQGGGRYRSPTQMLRELEVPFSLADDGQLLFVVLLGLANLVGAGYLGLQFSSLDPQVLQYEAWLANVQSIYPALLAYAVGFFAAPLLRFLSVGSRNKEIEERNESRRQWLKVLRSGEADGRLAEARKYRESMRTVGAGDTVYSTAEDSTSRAIRDDLSDFDRKLRAGAS